MKNLTERKLRFSLLLLAAVLAVYFATAVHLGTQRVFVPERSVMLDASRRMERCMEAVKQLKIERGIPIDTTEDVHETGMLGTSYTAITTTLGALEAKRTTANPDMAALCVRLLSECGVKAGDRVGCSFSGSFPAMNIAVVCALDAIGATAVYVSSIGASTYGANQAELTSPEMLHHLYLNGLIQEDSAAITFGGDEDLGLNMNIAGFPEDEIAFEDMLRRYEEEGLTITKVENLEDNIRWRMELFGEIDCFVNVGSNVTATRDLENSLGCGILVKPASLHVVPGNGLVLQYLAIGVPVVHLLDIKALCAQNGLAFDPAQLPGIGTSAIYFQEKPPVPLLIFGIGVVVCLLVLIRFSKKFLALLQSLEITVARQWELSLGWLLVGLGVAMPAMFTVYNIGVYDSLYQALAENNSGYLILAAFQLLLLNVFRALPHYIGAFYIVDAIAVSRKGLLCTVMKLLLFFPLILIVYQLIQMIYGLRYDFGVPAVSMILFLVILNTIDFSQVSILKKTLMVFFMLAAVQSLDLMPALAGFPFGNGEATMDIKQISTFLNVDSLLQWFLVVYFVLTGVSALLFVILIRDENNILVVSRQKEQSERELMEVRLAALESRTYTELAHLAHDLKTPLTSMQALVGVVKLSNKEKRSGELLDKIEISIEHMSALISEFLDENKFCRLQANELIDEVLAQISTLPYCKLVQVSYGEDDLIVEANRVRFCRMLTNLMENSYHAIDPVTGVIRVEVGKKRVKGKPMVCFAVADNGKGMTKAVRASMWKEGFSLSGSYGLGLSFVKRVVETHKGTIEVESEVDKGTRIVVSIPQERK